MLLFLNDQKNDVLSRQTKMEIALEIPKRDNELKKRLHSRKSLSDKVNQTKSSTTHIHKKYSNMPKMKKSFYLF